MEKDKIDSFLRAEEEAQILVEELKQLKEAIAVYRGSHKEAITAYKASHEALGQAADEISELAVRCSGIAKQLGELGKALYSIGTPELLERVEILRGELSVLHEGFERFYQELGSTRETFAEHIEALRGELKVLHEDLNELETYHLKFDNIRKTFAERIDDLGNQIKALRKILFTGVAFLIIQLVVLIWLLYRL